jgi:hypothetical protein
MSRLFSFCFLATSRCKKSILKNYCPITTKLLKCIPYISVHMKNVFEISKPILFKYMIKVTLHYLVFLSESSSKIQKIRSVVQHLFLFSLSQCVYQSQVSVSTLVVMKGHLNVFSPVLLNIYRFLKKTILNGVKLLFPCN